MDYSTLIDLLRQKQHPADLEKDILDTADELLKIPFDRSSSEWQAKANYAKYPAMYGTIMALPNTTPIPWEQMTDQAVRSCLFYQLTFLVEKEWGDKVHGKQNGTDTIRKE